jgi:hypothetical protein
MFASKMIFGTKCTSRTVNGLLTIAKLPRPINLYRERSVQNHHVITDWRFAVCRSGGLYSTQGDNNMVKVKRTVVAASRIQW